jgi:hypothetical protein
VRKLGPGRQQKLANWLAQQGNEDAGGATQAPQINIPCRWPVRNYCLGQEMPQNYFKSLSLALSLNCEKNMHYNYTFMHLYGQFRCASKGQVFGIWGGPRT